MQPISVAIVNHSRLEDEDVLEGLNALQIQVSRDFCPAWGIDATLRFIPAKEAARPELISDWGLIIMNQPPDHSVPGSLGYHDLTRGGMPLSMIFIDRIPQGQDWVHTASHELLEMLADPDLNRVAIDHPDSQNYRLVAQEICDPCEPYEHGYDIGDRRVSDFVLPAWFLPRTSRRAAAAQGFDERRIIPAPFTAAVGGYFAIYDPKTGSWIIELSGPDPEDYGLGSRLDKRNSSSNRLAFSDWEVAP